MCWDWTDQSVEPRAEPVIAVEQIRMPFDKNTHASLILLSDTGLSPHEKKHFGTSESSYKKKLHGGFNPSNHGAATARPWSCRHRLPGYVSTVTADVYVSVSVSADLLFLMMCLLFQAVKTAHDVTDWLPDTVRRVWPYVEPYIWPLASIAQTCNVWLVVVLTADRYVAICKPLHASQYR